MFKVAALVESHLEGILAHWKWGVTNAFMELVRLAGAWVLSARRNQTRSADFPEVSRVNMRSVQTERSTHHRPVQDRNVSYAQARPIQQQLRRCTRRWSSQRDDPTTVEMRLP